MLTEMKDCGILYVQNFLRAQFMQQENSLIKIREEIRRVKKT